MPEGPEIRRAADRIQRAIAVGEPCRVEFAFERLKPYARRLSGRRVTAVDTRGKAMLIRFEGDLSIYTHSQLYGRWYVTQGGKLPATRRSLRLAIHAPGRSALLYSASEIEVLRPEDVDRHPFLSRLGPDALDPRVTPETLRERLSDRRFARRRLHALLLDQGFVAGIGNYLRSEILFVAGIHPTRRPAELEPEARNRLAHAIRAVTRRAYQTGGITNDRKRAAALKKQGLRRGEYRHHVFDRGGRPCWSCGAEILRADAGGRKIFVCPGCQPGPELTSAATRGRTTRGSASRPRRRSRPSPQASPGR